VSVIVADRLRLTETLLHRHTRGLSGETFRRHEVVDEIALSFRFAPAIISTATRGPPLAASEAD
jgi:hypothetical protein